MASDWVGLSLEEIWDSAHGLTRIQKDDWVATDADLIEFAHIVEAKLREKNAGKPAAEDKAGGDEPVACVDLETWCSEMLDAFDPAIYQAPAGLRMKLTPAVERLHAKYCYTRPQPQLNNKPKA